MKSQPITVTRVDPETGELQGEPEKVPADHFKPKLPKAPKLDESRLTLVQRGTAIGPTGPSVIYMTSHREKELAYWEAHASCLTREERRDIANGRTTSVLRPIPPAWSKGDCVDVADKIEATVVEMEFTHRGHRSVFCVLDCRPWYLKQTVGGGSRPKVDEYGYPAELNDGEKERARVDGAYTRSASLAVPDSGDVMDDKLTARLHAEQSMSNALKQWKGRARTSKIRLEHRLLDARNKNRRSTVRYLERQLDKIEEKDEKAAEAA